MSENLVMPKIFSLEQLALHKIAKILWNILVSQYSENISVSLRKLYHSDYLKKYQQKVLTALPRVLPTVFPKLLRDRLVDAVIALRLGCGEAFDWIMFYRGLIELSHEVGGSRGFKIKCQNVLSPTNKDPDKNKYEASRFVDPLGHFDDLAWAKVFATDESKPLKCRFYLACHYCFEEEINNLWRTMEADDQSLSEDDLSIIWFRSRYLIELWISRLKNENNHSFYALGLEEAVLGYHEHAAKFFWKHCSVDVRERILKLGYFALAFGATRNRGSVELNRAGFVQFIYNLLSAELKNNLVSYVIQEPKGVRIWCCMLRSYYYKSILNDILTFPVSIPLAFYQLILDELVSMIKNSSLPQQIEVFKALWNRLSQDEKSQVMGSSKILAGLIENAGVALNDLLEIIILPLPPSSKENVLLHDFQMAGLSRLYWFFRTNNREGFLRYLLLFFLDCDAQSQKITLRSDNAHLLARLMNDEYAKWKFAKVFRESQAQKFNKLLELFKEILPVLDELVKKKNDFVITHDFLSQKMYSLLSNENEEQNSDAIGAGA